MSLYYTDLEINLPNTLVNEDINLEKIFHWYIKI